jgi:hypothetical protein
MRKKLRASFSGEPEKNIYKFPFGLCEKKGEGYGSGKYA